MGRIVAEAWLGRIGLLRRQQRDHAGGDGGTQGSLTSTSAPAVTGTMGVLAFEVAGLMSRVAHLWHSLAEPQVTRLRDQLLRLEGVRKLVSDDPGFLLVLALSEMLDALGAAARAAAVLCRRCSVPALQRLEHVLPDIVSAAVAGGGGMTSDSVLQGWAFAEKKMERKVRKMEKLAATTVQLYQEMEVLAEVEQSLRRAQANSSHSLSSFFQGISLMDLRQKVAWQKQEVKTLRDHSLWNRTYDYVVRLLARSLFTIVVRINLVFGFHTTAAPDVVRGGGGPSCLPRSRSVAGTTHSSSLHRLDNEAANTAVDVGFCSGPLVGSRMRSAAPLPRTKSGPIGGTNGIVAISGQRRSPSSQNGLPPLPGGKHSTRWSVSGGPFRGCMVDGAESSVLQSYYSPKKGGGFRKSNAAPLSISLNDSTKHAAVPPRTSSCSDVLGTDVTLHLFDSRRKLLLCVPPSTLGACALALHYANIVIVIEKLAATPHLIGPEARDDLYQMLPTSIRAALRARLKPYAKNLVSCPYDPVLAAEWSDAVTRILEWLPPLAHNMVRWQSERNYEQQHWVLRSNVLLLQTLYFANQAKTEAAIVELLVGLNYLWRFAREMNNKAILECASSREFKDCRDVKR